MTVHLHSFGYTSNFQVSKTFFKSHLSHLILRRLYVHRCSLSRTRCPQSTTTILRFVIAWTEDSIACFTLASTSFLETDSTANIYRVAAVSKRPRVCTVDMQGCVALLAGATIRRKRKGCTSVSFDVCVEILIILFGTRRSLA